MVLDLTLTQEFSLNHLILSLIVPSDKSCSFPMAISPLPGFDLTYIHQIYIEFLNDTFFSYPPTSYQDLAKLTPVMHILPVRRDSWLAFGFPSKFQAPISNFQIAWDSIHHLWLKDYSLLKMNKVLGSLSLLVTQETILKGKSDTIAIDHQC